MEHGTRSTGGTKISMYMYKKRAQLLNNKAEQFNVFTALSLAKDFH